MLVSPKKLLQKESNGFNFNDLSNGSINLSEKKNSDSNSNGLSIPFI